MSLFDWLREEAGKKNLLGSSYAGGEEFTIKGERPTFQEAKKARNNTLEFGVCKTAEATNSYIIQGIKDLASGDLKGAKLAFFVHAIDYIANGYYTEDGYQKAETIPNVSEDTIKLAKVGYNMAYATAFLEGNLPPNDLGYIPDQSVSLVRKDEIALECFSRANMYINAYLDLFNGSLNIDNIFNNVADRLESQRPTFCEKPVRKDVSVTRR